MKALAAKPTFLNAWMHHLKVFLSLLRLFSKLGAAYKLDLALRWLGYPARLLITYLLWSYLLKINGADKQQTTIIIVYFVFALFLGQLYSFVRMARDIREEIYSGDIAVYLVRPLSHFFTSYAKSVMTVLLNTLIILPVIFVIGFLMTGYIPTFFQVLLFVLAFLIGFTITFMIYYLIALTSFFTGEIIGTLRTFWIISDFLGGVFLPLSFFPATFQNILMFSPFQFWVYLPAAVISGDITVQTAMPQLFIGMIWIILLAVSNRIIWNLGTSRYLGNGI